MSNSSVLDGDAKYVASRLFGLSEDSHWYNIHTAVHRLDVGSVFSVRYTAIPGQPIISCKVPAGVTPSSVFHVQLPPSLVALILEKNKFSHAPMGEAVQPEGSNDGALFHVQFQYHFLQQVVQAPDASGSGINDNCGSPCDGSVRSPILPPGMECAPSDSLPLSIPVQAPDLPVSPVTQTALDVSLFLQDMEVYRQNRHNGIIASLTMNQSAAEEEIESVAEENVVASPPMNQSAAEEEWILSEEEKVDDNFAATCLVEEDEGILCPITAGVGEEDDEEDKENQALLLKVAKLVKESRNDPNTTILNNFVTAPSQTQPIGKGALATSKRKATLSLVCKSPRVKKSNISNVCGISVAAAAAMSPLSVDSPAPMNQSRVQLQESPHTNVAKGASQSLHLIASQKTSAMALADTSTVTTQKSTTNSEGPSSLGDGSSHIRQEGLPDYGGDDGDVPESEMAPTGLMALLEEEKEAEENEDVCCFTCGKTPCEWLEYGVVALNKIESQFDCSTAKVHGYVVEMGSANHVSNNRIRFSMYRMFTYKKFGCLSCGFAFPVFLGKFSTNIFVSFITPNNEAIITLPLFTTFCPTPSVAPILTSPTFLPRPFIQGNINE
jgi:hypothetical protein